MGRGPGFPVEMVELRLCRVSARARLKRQYRLALALRYDELPSVGVQTVGGDAVISCVEQLSPAGLFGQETLLWARGLTLVHVLQPRRDATK